MRAIFSFIANEAEFLSSFASFERIVSFIGLLFMGWFFWRRETTRYEETKVELKEEIELLQARIVELEEDNRELHKDNRQLHQEIRDILADNRKKRR